ncbi:MAG: DegT/DnrJ/EryC1/StrS family aminotransferase, partial [Hyphomicrobiales bacterium]
MLNTPFSPWPSFDHDDVEAVRRVLLSGRANYWTGEEGRAFEAEFARWTRCRHAVAVANGTVALDLVWKALGLARGDEVVVTPRTFLASVSSIINAGASPVFADVDADSQNITPASVERAMSRRTRAILCVHLNGWPCEMDPLRELAGAAGVPLVEDCAQAHGARYRARPAGGLGVLAAWSFCQDKIMSTGGEGGMVTTNNAAYRSAIWSCKDHGKSLDAVCAPDHAPRFRWLHERFGTNGRLTEMQSAIGRVQLRRMPQWHAARARNAAQILDAARTCPALRVPEVPGHITHAWYKCYVFVRPSALREGWDRDRIVHEINR